MSWIWLYDYAVDGLGIARSSGGIEDGLKSVWQIQRYSLTTAAKYWTGGGLRSDKSELQQEQCTCARCSKAFFGKSCPSHAALTALSPKVPAAAKNYIMPVIARTVLWGCIPQDHWRS
jgi:hypothetical protein